MAVMGNTIEGITNINYKAIVEVFIKAYFKVIAKKSAIFVRNQIAS